MCTFYFVYFLLGVLINLPLLVVFFVILLIVVGMFIFCVLLNIFSESCLFVTELFTFSCVFSKCRLFLFMISPCSVFTKYDLCY